MTNLASGELSYQSVSPDDTTWLADVYIASLRDPITTTRGVWNEEVERAQFVKQLLFTDPTIIQARGNRVGFYAIQLRTDALFLHTLCILPEHQNKGYGTAVMRALAERASGPIQLSVLKSNLRARRFYERLGYRWVSATQHHDELKWT